MIIGGVLVKKEEILEKIQANKQADEREKTISSNSYVWSSIAVSVTLIIIFFIRLFNSISFYYDLMMILMIQQSTASLYAYLQTKERKTYLVLTIAGFILFVLFTILTLVNYEI